MSAMSKECSAVAPEAGFAYAIQSTSIAAPSPRSARSIVVLAGPSTPITLAYMSSISVKASSSLRYMLESSHKYSSIMMHMTDRRDNARGIRDSLSSEHFIDLVGGPRTAELGNG